MKNNDWLLREDEDEFGEALHRRTEELYSVQDALPDTEALSSAPYCRCATWWCSHAWFRRSSSGAKVP